MKTVFASVVALAFVAGCATSSGPAPAAAAAKPAAVKTAAKDDPGKKICRMQNKKDKVGTGGAGSFERVCMTKAEWDVVNKVDEAHKRDMGRAMSNGGDAGGP